MATEFPISCTTLFSAVTATGAQPSTSGRADYKTFQASGTTTAGAGTATVIVQGSGNGTNWDNIGTLALTALSTTPGSAGSSDSFTSTDRYLFIRGNVTAISGTGASVTLTMCC